jgi:hypothetical protein
MMLPEDFVHAFIHMVLEYKQSRVFDLMVGDQKEVEEVKVVPIKKKSSITPTALSSLMHKSCTICSDDDPVPIHSLEEAYDHAWDHWDAWQTKLRGGAVQLTLFDLEELDERNSEVR